MNMFQPVWPHSLPHGLPQQQHSQETLQRSPGGAGASIGAGQETQDNVETQLENLCLSVTERVLEK